MRWGIADAVFVLPKGSFLGKAMIVGRRMGRDGTVWVYAALQKCVPTR
jgi:hypothetical protein